MKHDKENDQRSQVEDDEGDRRLIAAAISNGRNDSGLNEHEENWKDEDEAHIVSTQQQVNTDFVNTEVCADSGGRETAKKPKSKTQNYKDSLHRSSSDTMLSYAADEEIIYTNSAEETLQIASGGSKSNEIHRAGVASSSLFYEEKQESVQSSTEMSKELTGQSLSYTDSTNSISSRRQTPCRNTRSLQSFDTNSGRLRSISAANLAMAQRFMGRQTVTFVGRRTNTPLHQEYDAEGGDGVMRDEATHSDQMADFSAHVFADLVGDAAPVTEEELRARILRESARAEVVEVESKQQEQDTWAFYANIYWWALILLCFAVFGAIVVIVIFISGNGANDDTLPANVEQNVMITTTPSLTPSSQPSTTSRPSMQPTTTEMLVHGEFLYNLIRPISGDTLVLPNSPQSQAFKWLLAAGDCALCAVNSTDSAILIERYALAVLYFSTNGPEWNTNLGFLSTKHHCTWNVVMHGQLHGVGCQNDFVSMLLVTSNNLKGTLPPEIGSFPALHYLDLYSNQLFGAIPSSLAQLKLLSGIALDYNMLSGIIPSSLFDMESLVSLWLNDNILSGSLPKSIGSTTVLADLIISGNFLTGTIPTELSTLKQLSHLILSENLFVGKLPSFAENDALVSLQLGNSQLSGLIPTTLGNCKNLEFITIYHVSLNGTLPTEIAALPMLVEVYITNTGLSGIIPAFTSSSMSFLTLSDNHLTGSLEELFAQSPIKYVSFIPEENLPVGSIPHATGNYTILTGIFLSNNYLTGTIGTGFGLLTTLNYFDLSGNQLNGTIPTELGQLSAMLELNLSENYLQGQLPSELGSMSSLQQLTVFTNNMTGTIPIIIAELEILADLQIYNNSFDGTLSAFCNRTQIGFVAADCSKLNCGCCNVCCNLQTGCTWNTSAL